MSLSKTVKLGGLFLCLLPVSTPLLAATIQVWPDHARPGDILQVTAEPHVWNTKPAPRVQIGGKVAPLIGKVNASNVRVVVPLVPKGTRLVEVISAGQSNGPSAQVEIGLPPTMLLVLVLTNNHLTLLSTNPSTDNASQTKERSEPRISYEVLDARGTTLFRGEVVHPVLGRREVYEPESGGKGPIRRTPPDATSTTFIMVVPNLQKMRSVRFYDAAAGLDLSSKAGRAARKRINEIEVRPFE